MSQIILVPASKLTLSPLNVRKVQNEAANLQLRADIVARGVIQNLIGLPVPRKKGHYAITAGGRRLTQVHAAIAAGELPAPDECTAFSTSCKANGRPPPMSPSGSGSPSVSSRAACASRHSRTPTTTPSLSTICSRRTFGQTWPERIEQARAAAF